MEDENLPNKVDELIADLANKDPIIPASISLVPYFGGALATFYSSKWQQISQRRTEALLSRFGEELKSQSEEVIKKDYFDTEEGIDLLFKATEESAKTRNEEKRELIARILAGATKPDSTHGEYSPEEYLNMIADLTEKELQIARTIYERHHRNSPRELEPNNRAATWALVNQKLIEQYGIDADALPLYLNRLHLAGLLDLYYVTAPSSSVPTYWVSLPFKNLMEFLKPDR